MLEWTGEVVGYQVGSGPVQLNGLDFMISRGGSVRSMTSDPPPQSSEIDAKLTELLTDRGKVIGANSPHLKNNETGEVQDNHYQFANGVVHTVHIVGDGANVYIPKEFSDVRVSSKDTVVATNPKTREVFMIAHVKIGIGKIGKANLNNNMKTVRDNGTVLIGEMGGAGGEAGRWCWYTVHRPRAYTVSSQQSCFR